MHLQSAQPQLLLSHILVHKIICMLVVAVCGGEMFQKPDTEIIINIYYIKIINQSLPLHHLHDTIVCLFEYKYGSDLKSMNTHHDRSLLSNGMLHVPAVKR